MTDPIAISTGDLEEPEDRFSRFRLIGWWDQKRLASAKALVVGAGALGNEIVKNLALLGWGPSDGVEVRPLEEIVGLFRLEDVNSSPAFFDVKKLTAINGDYIRALPTSEMKGMLR